LKKVYQLRPSSQALNAAELLSKDEVRRIPAKIAKLPVSSA
jgi:hypothetical protein